MVRKSGKHLSHFDQWYLMERSILKSGISEWQRTDSLCDNLSGMVKVSHYCPQTLRLNMKYLQKSRARMAFLRYVIWCQNTIQTFTPTWCQNSLLYALSRTHYRFLHIQTNSAGLQGLWASFQKLTQDSHWCFSLLDTYSFSFDIVSLYKPSYLKKMCYYSNGLLSP